MNTRQTTRSQPKTHKKNETYFVHENTEGSETEFSEVSEESTSDTSTVVSPQYTENRSRSANRGTTLRSREEEPEIRSSSRSRSSRREEEATKPFRSSSRSRSRADEVNLRMEASRNYREEEPEIRRSSRSGLSKREEEATKRFTSSSRSRSRADEVTFGMEASRNKQPRERSASGRRDAEETVRTMPLSKQRSHSGSKNSHRHYFELGITKIRGMSTIPTVRPYFKDLKIRIYVTLMGETVQSPQITRSGTFDPDDLVFQWPLSSKMAQIAMDEFELKLVLKLERDEEKGLRKWTHVVGTTTITKDSGKRVNRGTYRVDLEAEVRAHGLQQLEYSVNVL